MGGHFLVSEKVVVVVPWYREDLRDKFLDAWDLNGFEPFLHLEQDAHREGCAVTKNKGVRAAMDDGADVVIVLDDDCYPHDGMIMEQFVAAHLAALEPADVPLMRLTTDPPARGTPYYQRTVKMPVAASMGFWSHTPDYDACAQLVRGAEQPLFMPGAVFGQYFPLCGMNLAFRPSDWLPWCQFVGVPRFDDIWMGWLWEREAYRRGYCFNLSGPTVMHSRASNVWQNLREEAKWMEQNETLWRTIHHAADVDYASLRSLLPC